MVKVSVRVSVSVTLRCTTRVDRLETVIMCNTSAVIHDRKCSFSTRVGYIRELLRGYD